MLIKWVFLDDDVDNSFYEDDLETITYVRLFADCNKFEKHKAFKKDISKKLMPVAWHLTKWLDWCFS